MGHMNDSFVICALCGHQFHPESRQDCGSCPVQPDCNIICCPACGFSDVDPTKSKAVKWITSGLFKSKAKKGSEENGVEPSTLTIADLSPGMEARIVSLQAVHELRRELLMAYGLAPGSCVQVLQHKPVTILRVDHMELAVEDDVARRITVDQPRRIGRKSLRGGMRRRHRLRQRLKFLRSRGRKGKHSTE